MPTDVALDRPYRELGQQLRTLRERRGLSVLHVARALGVGRRCLEDVEHGRYRPSRPRVQHLATLLGADASELTRIAGYEER